MVGEEQLELDAREVAHRIDRRVDVRDGWVAECAHDVDDRVRAA